LASCNPERGTPYTWPACQSKSYGSNIYITNWDR
jgi:hypothetical protein